MTTSPIAPVSPAVAAVLDAILLRVPPTGAPATPPPKPLARGQGEPAPPPTPPTAVSAALQAAASRQGGLAPLFADLEAALRTPGLPAPVQAAATQVLRLQMPLDAAPTPAALRQAVAQSGLFLEAQLATAEPPAADGDLKAALLNLAQVLEAWLGPAVQRSAAPTAGSPAPPYRGGPLQGQAPSEPSLPADASADIVGARLLHEVAAAEARQVMTQIASLPSSAKSPEQTAPAHWLIEIPVATPQGPAVAQLEISRDGKGGGEGDAQPVWRAGFSLNLDPMGPVHGRVALSGEQAQVTLWAENGDTLAKLRDRSGDLSAALKDDELTAQVAVYPGAPRVAPPAAGQLVDRAS